MSNDNLSENQELLARIAELEQLITQVYIHNTRFNLVERQVQAMGVDLQHYVQRYFDDLLVGSVTAFAMTTPPEGWLVCDGRAVKRADYSRLFARIGTTFGEGDSITTFNLPNLNGVFVRGYDAQGKTDPNRKFGQIQGDQIQTHTHKDSGHSHSGETSEDGEHDHSDKIDISQLADAVEQSRNFPDELSQQVVALAKVGFEQAIAPARKSGETSAEGKHSHNGNVSSNGGHYHKGNIYEGGSHSHNAKCSDKWISEGLFGSSKVSYAISSGTDEYRISSDGSSHTHSLNIEYAGSHSHTLEVDGLHSHEIFVNSDGNHSHRVFTQNAHALLGNPTNFDGSRISHGNETRPKNLALLYCIKY